MGKRTERKKRPNDKSYILTLENNELSGLGLARIWIEAGGKIRTWHCASVGCAEEFAHAGAGEDEVISLHFYVFSKKERLYVAPKKQEAKENSSDFWPHKHGGNEFAAKVKDPAFRRSLGQRDQAELKARESKTLEELIAPLSKISKESLPIRVRCRNCGRVCILRDARFPEV